MTDHLRAHDAALERLRGLRPKKIDLSLDRIQALLQALGRPQDRLPPVIHVAGTNGKGSTVAVLRAIGEAAGLKVHVYTSPHLVRFVERIRLAGELISEAHLAEALARVEAANAGQEITFFEITGARRSWGRPSASSTRAMRSSDRSIFLGCSVFSRSSAASEALRWSVITPPR